MKAVDQCVIVVGKESTGKSLLISAITGRAAYSSNFRGATVACDVYQGADFTFIDTPGIIRESDTLTTRAALRQLNRSDAVLLVLQATHIDDDLADLLPLLKGKQGTVIVTFWDKVQANESASRALENMRKVYGLPFIPVDARHLTAYERKDILAAIEDPQPFKHESVQCRAGWRIDPPPTLLEVPYVGQLLALVLLLLPAIAAVWIANSLAQLIDPLVQAVLTPLVVMLGGLPSLPKEILVGNYGLLTMGPLLFIWAAPTVILYSFILGAYKASGLIDRLTSALHPVMRHFGLSGRDVVRVVMGFGCNVPAVVSTRACSVCSRRTCISAIAFGSACSYQMGATLGVFAAAHLPFLVVPYLVFLTATTLIYTRIVSPREARSQFNILMTDGRAFLEWPRMKNVWREARGVLLQFFKKALPIFLLIAVIASILNWLHIIALLASLISPLLWLFRLPPEAALSVLMASIRKDGILLFATQNVTASLLPGQILTGVYLAGVLLPCLVTTLTIAREETVRFALRLVRNQAFAACCFSLVLAWATALLGW